MSGDRIITRDFLLNTVNAFCGSFTYFILTASIASYAMWRYGVSTTEAGLATGLFVLSGLLSRLLLGRFIESVGRKKTLIAAIIAAMVASLLYFTTETFLLLLVVRVIHGAAYSLCNSTTNDIITKMLPVERRGEGLGYFLLSVTLSTAIGPYLALLFVGVDAYNMVFTICIIANLVSLLIVLIMKVAEEELTPEQKKAVRQMKLRDIFYLPAVPQSIVNMLLMLSYSGVMSFIAVYSKSIGLNDVAMYFYVAYSASTVVSRFTVGKIFDTKGANYVMIPGYVAFISGMLIYSQAVSSAVFIIPGVLMGFAISTVFPTSQTMIMRDVHPHKFGSAVSTFQSITDIGTGFGPMIIGAIIASTGYRHTYLICAAIATFSFLMYWVTYGRKNRIRGTSSLPDIQD